MKSIAVGLAISVLSIGPGFCQDLPLDGDWSCVNGCTCKRPVRDPAIAQQGNNLKFTNECNEPSGGGRNGNHVKATNWSLEGDVTLDGDKLTLNFNNNTTWQRANGPIATKIRFAIDEPGSFGLKTLKELGTQQAAAIVTAACAAFGADCSDEASAGAAAIKAIVVGDKKNGNQHNGIFRAPVGFSICKAKIDMAHGSVDSGSSFSGEIGREPGNNGLGFYAAVPQFQNAGHSVEADLYLEFVPAATFDQYGCWPSSDHSLAAHLWNCNHGNCQVIKPEARYP